MTGPAAAAHLLAHFTLSRGWIVLHATAAASPWIAPAVGLNIWDVWPAAEPIFRPLHERAWNEGHAEGREFFMGVLFHVTATVVGDDLRVTYRELAHLEITTAESLGASLAAMRLLVSQQDPAPIQRLPSRQLRVVRPGI